MFCIQQVAVKSLIKFIRPVRKPQAFKPGDEWRPERSLGDPAKPGGPKETLDFSPGSFIFKLDLLLSFHLALASLEELEKESLVKLPGTVSIGVGKGETVGGGDPEMFQDRHLFWRIVRFWSNGLTSIYQKELLRLFP